MSTLGASRSKRLVDQCRGHLERSKTVRFVSEASAGDLSERHFARYLAIEEAFVQTVVRVNAYCLYREPDWATVEEHAASIAALLGEQLGYFGRMRSGYGDSAENIERAVRASGCLSRYVLELVDSQGYAGAIVSMFAAETLYSEWCAKSAGERHLDILDGADEWITLHATPAFALQAEKLAALVDRLPEETNHSSRGAGASDEQMVSWFIGMLESEDAFHGSIYFDGE